MNCWTVQPSVAGFITKQGKKPYTEGYWIRERDTRMDADFAVGAMHIFGSGMIGGWTQSSLRVFTCEWSPVGRCVPISNCVRSPAAVGLGLRVDAPLGLKLVDGLVT